MSRKIFSIILTTVFLCSNLSYGSLIDVRQVDSLRVPSSAGTNIQEQLNVSVKTSSSGLANSHTTKRMAERIKDFLKPVIHKIRVAEIEINKAKQALEIPGISDVERKQHQDIINQKEEEIQKYINERNAEKSLVIINKTGVEAAPTHFVEDLVDDKLAIQALIRGELCLQMPFAGAGSRMSNSLKKLGIEIGDTPGQISEKDLKLANIDIWQIAVAMGKKAYAAAIKDGKTDEEAKAIVDEKGLVLEKPAYAQNIGFAERHMLALEQGIMNLAIPEYEKIKIRDNLKIIVSVSDDIRDGIMAIFRSKSRLTEKPFFGFKRENVVFVEGGYGAGYRIDDNNNIVSVESVKTGWNHGFAFEELAWITSSSDPKFPRVYILNEKDERETIPEGMSPFGYVQAKGAKFSCVHRINDLLLLHPDMALDAQMFGAFLKFRSGQKPQDRANVFLEMMTNPTGQKGGMALTTDGKRLLLFEGLNTIHDEVKVELDRIAEAKLKETEGKMGVPYNRLYGFYKIKPIIDALEKNDGLPLTVTYKDGIISPEIPTGDITLLADKGIRAYAAQRYNDRFIDEGLATDHLTDKDNEILPDKKAYTRGEKHGSGAVIHDCKEAKYIKDGLRLVKALDDPDFKSPDGANRQFFQNYYYLLHKSADYSKSSSSGETDIETFVNETITGINRLKDSYTETAMAERLSRLIPDGNIDAVDDINAKTVLSIFHNADIGVAPIYFIEDWVDDALAIEHLKQGKLCIQMPFAGAGNRMHDSLAAKGIKIPSENMKLANIDIWQIAKEMGLIDSIPKHALRMGLAEREMLALEQGILNLKKSHGLTDDELSQVFQNMKLIISVSDDIKSIYDIFLNASKLTGRRFFGFRPENVVFVDGGYGSGFEFNKESGLFEPAKNSKTSWNHGFAFAELAWAAWPQAYILTGDRTLSGEPIIRPISDSVFYYALKRGAEYSSIHRVNDLILLHPDMALDIDMFGAFLNLAQNSGINLYMEMMANPTGQKGGWALTKDGTYLTLFETLATKDSQGDISRRMDEIAKIAPKIGAHKGIPYNRLYGYFDIKEVIRALISDDMPLSIKRDKKNPNIVSPEIPTGDITHLNGVRALAGVRKRDVLIEEGLVPNELRNQDNETIDRDKNILQLDRNGLVERAFRVDKNDSKKRDEIKDYPDIGEQPPKAWLDKDGGTGAIIHDHKEAKYVKDGLQVVQNLDSPSSAYFLPTLYTRSSSAGTILDINDVSSLTMENVDKVIASAVSPIDAKILSDVKLAAEVVKFGVGGTVVFNDEGVSDAQRATLQSLLDINSPYLYELEQRMGATVRLKSQLSQADIKDPQKLIFISKEELKGYPGAKHLLFQARVDLADGYLPVMPMIAMAKALLNLTDKSQVELISAVKNLSRNLRYGINLTDDVIKNYIDNGVFMLELPKVERYDYDKLENLQRQALLTLISA
jgi:hypothetical protein